MKDSLGNYVLNQEKIELIRIGDGYITKELEFSVGAYTIEDFIVLDEAETAIYLTPKVRFGTSAIGRSSPTDLVHRNHGTHDGSCVSRCSGRLR